MDAKTAFESRLQTARGEIDVALEALLPKPAGPQARLLEAMRYAALAPGKRLRPFLCLEAGRMLGAPEEALMRAGCALELIHAYSLVHDDLPAMDDDDLRRGRPTCHKAFDEATAILAGDALQTLAFDVLADPGTHRDGAVRAELCRLLARAAGAAGMAGGQMVDLEGEARDLAGVETMLAMKTGALIACAFELPMAMATPAALEREALTAFARDIGVCFQMVDDLLDAEGDTLTLGKAAGGKDAAKGKANYVTLLGISEARERLAKLADEARGRLAAFKGRAHVLLESLEFVLDRRN